MLTGFLTTAGAFVGWFVYGVAVLTSCPDLYSCPEHDTRRPLILGVAGAGLALGIASLTWLLVRTRRRRARFPEYYGSALLDGAIWRF